MTKIGYSVDKIIENSTLLKQVHKDSLRPGDLLFITTHNSVYSIRVLDDDQYQVSGGWFDRKGSSPTNINISGCTWGGKIIKKDIVAACGMCLEFGNRVVTSPIRKVFVIPSNTLN